MNTNDSTRDIVRLGYTEREAGFLFLVCRASGYFIRSQYNAFIRREPGGLEQQLVDKLAVKQHAHIIQCSGNHHIYHITCRKLYSAAGFEDTTNRRLKSDEEVTRRLLTLECCLHHLNWSILYSEADRLNFFRKELRLPEHVLPWQTLTRAIRRGDSLRKFPVFVSPLRGGARRQVKFVFADPGLASSSQFQRYLELFSPLFRALGQFTLLYVTSREFTFQKARFSFEKKQKGGFAGFSPKLFPKGIEHFLSYLEAERRWVTSSTDLTSADVRLVNEGEPMYVAPIHTDLREANTQGNDVLLKKFVELGIDAPLQGTFEPQLVEVPRAMEHLRIARRSRTDQLDMQLGA